MPVDCGKRATSWRPRTLLRSKHKRHGIAADRCPILRYGISENPPVDWAANGLLHVPEHIIYPDYWLSAADFRTNRLKWMNEPAPIAFEEFLTCQPVRNDGKLGLRFFQAVDHLQRPHYVQNSSYPSGNR